MAIEADPQPQHIAVVEVKVGVLRLGIRALRTAESGRSLCEPFRQLVLEHSFAAEDQRLRPLLEDLPFQAAKRQRKAGEEPIVTRICFG